MNKLTDKQKQLLKNMVNNKCEACGEQKPLEIHRITRGIDGGKYIPRNIQMLCSDCHKLRDFI